MNCLLSLRWVLAALLLVAWGAGTSIQAQIPLPGPIIIPDPELPDPGDIVIDPVSAADFEWVRTIAIDVPGATAVAPHFGISGEIYFGVRGATEVAHRGLYRIDPGDTEATPAQQVAYFDDDVTGVSVNPWNGYVFVGTDGAVHLRRHKPDTSTAEEWSSFIGPEGETLGKVSTAIASPMYTDPPYGSSTRAFLVNDGDNSTMQMFESHRPDETEWLSDYPFQRPTDVCFGPAASTFASHSVYVSDQGLYPSWDGVIWRMTYVSSQPTSLPSPSIVATTEALKPDGLVYDGVTETLLVLDRVDTGHRLVRVDLDTGQVEHVGDVLHLATDLSGSIDISPDGTQLVLTNGTQVYVLERSVPADYEGDIPSIEESDIGWDLSNTATLEGGAIRPIAPHFGPAGAIYVGSRDSDSSNRALYRLAHGDAVAEKLESFGTPVGGVEVDHATGDVYVSLDYPGEIWKHDNLFGETTLWADGYYTSGDDDPVGLAVGPQDLGGLFFPGNSIYAADRGVNGVGGVCSIDLDDPTEDFHLSLGPDVVDLTFVPVPGSYAGYDVILANRGEGGAPGSLIRMHEYICSDCEDYWRLDTFGIDTSIPLAPWGVTCDPISGLLFVLDRSPGLSPRVVTVDPETGVVEHVLDLPGSGGYWASIDISPSGTQLVVSDREQIYVFDRAGYSVIIEDDILTGLGGGGIDAPQFIRGDANTDGAVNIADAITILTYVNGGGSASCLDAVDANHDESIDIADAVFTLLFVNGAGVTMPSPYPNCGTDAIGSLGCEDGGCP